MAFVIPVPVIVEPRQYDLPGQRIQEYIIDIQDLGLAEQGPSQVD
jgi:hypothetical protein